jgi:UDP-N-acetylglucosamine 2-epimerase (non-hydrolysing)
VATAPAPLNGNGAGPKRRRHVVSIVGTRPEAIKMAPVIRELAARPAEFEQTVVATAQHREMLDQVLELFEIVPDVDLELMQENQTLGQFASRSLATLSQLFGELEPDAILVQGDTTTVMTAGLAAFYRSIRVGHVEAGLRSLDRWNPFPEEINRKIAGCVADFHFAPTEGAAGNLRGERVAESSIFVTGNTIVDALQMLPTDGPFADDRLHAVDFEAKRVITVTAHRRENHGRPLRTICAALRELVTRFDDVEVVYPVHLNPNVRGPVYDELGGVAGIHLVDPVAYVDLLRLMQRSYLMLSDSGGIQEEAPSFRKPVLVLREVTERPELIEAGLGRIVGTETERVVAETERLLTDESAYAAMTGGENPFGDGRAAIRIADILERELGDRTGAESDRPAEPVIRA